MKYAPRMNRQERREMQAEKLKRDMNGSGIYVYENNTNSDLKLPKPTASGIRTVGPKNRFQGDSYYMSWVGNPMNLLRLVEVIVPKMTEQQIKEEIMNNEKQLILDQPDCITHQGKIERVVVEPTKIAINDNTEATPQKNSDVLLNESPLDGVEIIFG